MDKIIMEPIGYIESPFSLKDDIPRQSIYGEDRLGIIHLNKDYLDGLDKLDRNKHIIILFNFHGNYELDLKIVTHRSEEEKGVFATRSPSRPNKIGLSIVELLRIEGNKIYFKGVDMIDKTPVLDIKPYSSGLNPKDDEIE